VQEMLNTKKFGDIAFRDKDFKTAIEYYSKVISIVLFLGICNSCIHFCMATPGNLNEKKIENTKFANTVRNL
jgi:hypothetical protein